MKKLVLIGGSVLIEFLVLGLCFGAIAFVFARLMPGALWLARVLGYLAVGLAIGVLFSTRYDESTKTVYFAPGGSMKIPILRGG